MHATVQLNERTKSQPGTRQTRPGAKPGAALQAVPHARTPLSTACLAERRDKNLLALMLQSISAHPALPRAREVPRPAAGGAPEGTPLAAPTAPRAAPQRPQFRPLFPTIVLVVSPVQHGSALLPGRDGMNGTGWDGTGWGGRGGCARFEGDGRRRPDPRALIRGPAALRPPGPSVPVLTPSPSPPSFSPA